MHDQKPSWPAVHASGSAMPNRFVQGAFAVPPAAVGALAALLRDGRITLQLPPLTDGLGAPGHPAAKEERASAAAGGSGLAASEEAHVDVALTAHALSEEPEGALAHQQRNRERAARPAAYVGRTVQMKSVLHCGQRSGGPIAVTV